MKDIWCCGTADDLQFNGEALLSMKGKRSTNSLLELMRVLSSKI